MPDNAYVTKAVHHQVALFLCNFLFLSPSFCMFELIINVYFNNDVHSYMCTIYALPFTIIYMCIISDRFFQLLSLSY
jgi:hypothetical protein